MRSAFTHSERWLAGDSPRRLSFSLLLTAILAGGWVAWLVRARVAVYAVSEQRPIVMFVAIALLGALCATTNAQKVSMSSTTIKQEVLSLNFANNGQHVRATVGQQIEITLGTVGPAQYGAPLVSSPAIRLESTAFEWPPNPGGRTSVYIFEAAAVGKAQVIIPVLNSLDPDIAKKNTFVAMIQVERAAGKPRAFRKPDQTNTTAWTPTWTNLVNDVEQTFTPSLPTLTSVEVELVVANPGPSDEKLTLSLLNAKGEVLAVVSKTVPVQDCGHVQFFFPNGSWRVLPGQVYSIRLQGGSLFGWKYVVGGYKNGAASFNGKPLLPDRRSTFLFRTFGAEL